MKTNGSTTGINRHEMSRRAESIRFALQKLSSTLDGLMDDVGGEEGWPGAYETLHEVQSDIDRCCDSLLNRFPQ
jgi:hypothetical protein